MSFLSKYLEHTKSYESPNSFWLWSAFSTISAVLRDSVFVQQGDMNTYANIYVLLLAPSGIYRKGLPVNTCQKLLAEISNTKVISGRTSIQAILDEIGHVETSATSGLLLKAGSAIFLASELAAGLVSDPSSVNILTDLYDLKTDYSHHLKSTGKKKIEKIIFSMLGASNEELLKDVFDARAMRGGLLARTFLVKPDEFRPANSLLTRTDTKVAFQSIVDDLREVSKLKGEMMITSDALIEYDSWYRPFRESYKYKSDKAGVVGRIHMSIFKLSMILCANDLELAIRKEHIEKAIDLGMSLLPNYNSLVIGSGTSDIAAAGTTFIAELIKLKGERLSRKDFLRQNWSNIDGETLDKLAATLTEAWMIEVKIVDNTPWYAATQQCLDMMKGQI